MIIWREFTFDSAHFLPNVPDGHKCKRLHGHTFKVRVEVSGEIGEDGMVMDYGDISSYVKPVVDGILDHRLLNDITGLSNPTSENLAVWLFKMLRPGIHKLHAIEVQETCNSGARYEG